MTRSTGGTDAIAAHLTLSAIPEEEEQYQQEGDEADEEGRDQGLELVDDDGPGYADTFGELEKEEDEEDEDGNLSEDFGSPSSDNSLDSGMESPSSPVELPKKKGKAVAKAKGAVSLPESKSFSVYMRCLLTIYLQK
jgi:hypothetical protein